MAEIKIEKDRSVRDAPLVACITWKGETKHSVLTSIEVSGEDSQGPSWSFCWNDTFQIVQCRGCETISFRKLHHQLMSYRDLISILIGTLRGHYTGGPILIGANII